MARVYRIRKEVTTSRLRYLVDSWDSTGRRAKRRCKKARKADAFQQELDTHAATGLAVPRPVATTFAAWAKTWLAQKTALSQAGKKPRPSTP